MSYHASAFDDMAGSLRADASFEINTAHIFSSSFKASSLNGSGTTPRLLFTWNPYSSGGPAETLRQPEADATPLQQPQRAGEEATSPMLSTRQQGSEAGGEEAASPPAAAATGARPPLTISTLLQEMSGSGAGSPQLSASAAAALLTPHHQPLQQQHHSPADGASVHSTPSGAVLKRIPTSAKDGRQYFLDYSPPGAANNAPVVGGTMPSLMLPPNLSPKSRGVSPVLSSLPMPSQAQQVRRLPADTDGMDGEGRTSTATSPQVAPLMSPPRSSSIGGSGVLSVGPAFPPASLSQHHSGVYGIYGTSPQQRGQSSSLLGNSLNGAGLLAAATGGSPGVTQHNPYRTSPTFSPVQPGGVAQQQPALAHQPATRHLHINPAVATTTAARPVENTDADAELFEALEASPSTFIKRLLPPPPPLPEVARVLPMRGVVQTLCERWCSMVEAVLRAREFDNVTTPPPPPPPIPSPTDTAVPPRPVEDAEGKPAAASCPPAVVEELKTWYEAAAAWYEQLDQAGAASVDIRASSRTVAWAVDVVASGRGRRGGSGSGQHNTNGGSRYSNGGGRAAAGYRGGAGGGGGGYGYSGAGAYGTRGFGGYRGGRGGGTPVSAAAAAAAPFYPASLSSANAIHGGGGSELEAMTNNSTNNSRNAYYGSTFNPYAESWKFSGDAQLPPPPPMQAKGPYSGKMTATGPQGYAAHPTLNQM